MAKDIYHYVVRNALEREGWVITHDPLIIQTKGIEYDIDLGAERIIGAEKDEKQIAVEIKSFIHPSFITDFHRALGQFLNYRIGLRLKGENRELFLAIPEDTYSQFFHLPAIEESIKEFRIHLILFNRKTKKITKWISQNPI